MHLPSALTAGAGALALARLARGARRTRPLEPQPRGAPGRSVSVVVPARDEEHRIGPLLAAVVADPQVHELVVVDDESTDGTAAVAAAAGARVVPGGPLPSGWVGKPWALQQGLEAATGHWLLTLDADVEPRPGLAAALVAEAERSGADLVTAGGRFVNETPGARLLHPAMLATLLYRFGPPGVDVRSPARVQANGQCALVRRAPLRAAGGFGIAAGHLTDDVALARGLARRGWRVAFVDGTRLFDVRMHLDGRAVWRDWGRSLPMPDVTSSGAQALDLAVVWRAQALPLVRLVVRLALRRRPDPLDVALVAVRLGVVAATASAYRRPGLAHWLSPLADVPAAVRLTAGALRPGRVWRGRRYGPPSGSAAR